MTETNLRDTGKAVTLSEKVFGCAFKEPLIHQVVTAYLARGRSGTRAQKSRSEVRGGGKKPWRQKGTGRARSGTIRSPLWRGGGVTFAAKPQDYAQKINKKMYVAALRSILSELLRQDRMILLENFNVASNKTQQLAKQLKELGLTETLIVTENIDKSLYLAARNLYRVNICDAEGIDPVNLVKYEKILVTLPALRKIEEALS